MASGRDVKKFNPNRLAHDNVDTSAQCFSDISHNNCHSRDALKNCPLSSIQTATCIYNYHKNAEMGKRSHSDFVEPGSGKTTQVRFRTNFKQYLSNTKYRAMKAANLLVEFKRMALRM